MIEAYGSLYWFYILGLATVPAIVLGLLGKRIRPYTRVATLLMVVLMLGWATGQLWWLSASSCSSWRWSRAGCTIAWAIPT